jgi:hypothetical protein
MAIDTPIRIVVLVGVLVAAAGAAFALLVLGHSKSAAKTPLAPVVTHQPKTPVHTTVPQHAKPKPATPHLLEGLPAPIAHALKVHPLVVVALYQPHTGDSVSVTEARAGAAQAHTSFIALNVLKARDAGPIAGLTGSLADPGIVVVRRPGTVVRRLDGYQDRQVVAQAAHDAR